MSRAKEDGAVEKKEIKYRTEDLLGSKHLKDYQPDFARTVLEKPEYTVSEAKKALDTFFGKEC